MDIKDFRDELASLRLEPGMKIACLAITESLMKLRPGDGQHLPVRFFYEQVLSDYHQYIPSALSILCTHKNAVLELRAYIEDPEYSQIHLDDDVISELITSGTLVHPITGDLVKSPLDHVRIFYALRDRSLQ